jgi:hexosaminidase
MKHFFLSGKNYSPTRLNSVLSISIIIFFMFFYKSSGASEPKLPFLTELRSRGYSLIPAPQQVELGTGDIVVDRSWMIETKLGNEDIPVKRLIQGASELHNLRFSNSGAKKIVLEVVPGSVKYTDDPELNDQGYILKVTPGKIEVTANTETGVFYGVQSLLQLLRRNIAGELVLPECVIRDWPALQLRFVHWDTKHHQKRMETMKRLIDWHAFFKVNMIAFEMEDKYEYPRHPVIGAPGAYTKSEMQELTSYALERNIQIVPNIQAPAHMAYVLKHKEFEHLKAESVSNYQACMCDPEAINLIFDMYQDMIDATPGVDYFFVSTDEVYYAGICDKCQKPYNPENRSLAWTDFAIKAHDWLAERNRRMLAWVEYPLLAKDIALLPGSIINAIGSQKDFFEMQNKVGIKQLAYSSIQGSEYLFSNYFPSKLANVTRTVRQRAADGADLIGTFAAAWDDSGLHEEVFHLGWTTVTQYGWNPYGPTIEQTVADFMDVFYGQNSPDMMPVYNLLIEGAQFFKSGWERVKSIERGPSYGNSHGKGIGTGRSDDILIVPGIPAKGTLNITPEFSERYGDLIRSAENMKVKNDNLTNMLTSYIGKVERNRYNLEVYLSIAFLQRYFINTILTLHSAESNLVQANSAAAKGNHADAVAYMVEARNQVKLHTDWGKWMWNNLTEIWEKSRYEKGRSVNGRDFVYIMDDVKDHWADRRKGLDYMIAPFQRMDMPGWNSRLNERILEYASEHNIPVSGLEEERLED